MMLLLTSKHFLFFLISGFALVVYANDQSGFITIDCGLANGSSYTDQKTGLNYISDAEFIDSGKSRFILEEYQKKYLQNAHSLRSFPEGNRNCYKVEITRGTKYFIRASFVYGNYDQQLLPPAFDLYLGTDLWDSVVITSTSGEEDKEIIHVPRHNYVHVCLANTGNGIPFISTLEFRPLNGTSYAAEIGKSLLPIQRNDAGSTKAYRYSQDIHDRFWYSYLRDDWTSLNTSHTVDVSRNILEPPSVVMATAATPESVDYLDFNWQVPADHPHNISAYYIYMYFAEVQKLRSNQSRQFEIFHNGKSFYGPYSPLYLEAQAIISPTALIGGTHSIRISKTANSTLPPIINAWEVYRVKEFPQYETDQEDVDAMTSVKSAYGLKRNWQGDPCLPKLYSWEGIDCSYRHDNQLQGPRVISLNLSSSGLSGEVFHCISNLQIIQTLDLSNNNLTGSIPEFLSQLPNLKVLNLENNNLRGSIPAELLKKQKDGVLSLSVCGNPNLSSTFPCKKKNKKNFVLLVAASVVGAFILVITVAAIWWAFTRKRRRDTKATFQNGPLDTRKQQFTHSEIVSITNNFERTIGAGGFGNVYYGYVNNTQVAVKILSVSSFQGYHQFQAEVNLLMRVHHRNLTSLVGYCDDKNNIALIYEYMANGNLQEHLSGSNSNILKWEDRLLIATDTAQGLEYLHHGCKPPIIHRDVKTTNILLNEKFQAKLSDFGLSRIIPNYSHDTHVSTVVAGTPGYLDPEYHMSNRLNDKSDVYSFGVVLLEIITGRPAISKSSEKTHICQWVKTMLEKGDIESIVDPSLDGNFNINSAWKIVEIAINCVSQNSTERPTMSQVVGELKESSDMVLNQKKNCFDSTARMSSMSLSTSEISKPSAR